MALTLYSQTNNRLQLSWMITYHTSFIGWSTTHPRMVIQQPKGGLKPEGSVLTQGIWHLGLTNKTNTRWQLPWMVTYHPKEGHPPTQWWSTCLAQLDSIWSGLPMFGPVWLCLVPFGPVWPRLVLFDSFGSIWSPWPPLAPLWPPSALFGPVRSCLTRFGPVWPHLDPFWTRLDPFWAHFQTVLPVWPHLILFDTVWPCLDLFVPVWPPFFSV